MTLAVDCYKNGNKLGSGTATAASGSITSFTAVATVGQGRNVTMVVTDANSNAGRAWRSRVTADGGTTLTLAEPCPYA